MRARPALFDDAIRCAVLAYVEAPRSWREAFKAPALALRGFDPSIFA
jgi:hypothetical protein